jgi:AcrR family transcriptional regulator
MTYAEFQKRFRISRRDIFREVLAAKRGSIRVKNPERVLRNIEKIFTAALKISNRKGFQAMSMRDLSRESGMSMGALYSYFSGKEELLEMLQDQGRAISLRVLTGCLEAESDPAAKLNAAVRTHLYLTEVMQPWFYFSYMEAKNLSPGEMKKAVESERFTETVFADILAEGRRRGCFVGVDNRLTAGAIKALLQDWYLKRGKYAGRDIDVDRYAEFVLEFVAAYLRKPGRAVKHSKESEHGNPRPARARP